MTIFTVDCGIPESPLNGNLGNHSSTKETDNVTFQCNEDYVPSQVEIATCNSLGMWKPDPAEHNCTFIEGIIKSGQVAAF